MSMGESDQLPDGVGLDVETSTNRLLRKKYFVDKTTIVTSVDKLKPGQEPFSKIIRGGQVAISRQPKLIRCERRTPLPGEIQVEVVREGQKITGIRISCPCGRHAELDCEYSADAVPSDLRRNA
ncbi:MAG: hypothetical protein JXR37_37920 [Kiritimatiellae bacterium]|nr:hypothetical protein [Kiritimatiellia bacterium]